MLTDTHAHLDFPEFEEDFEQVLSRAEAAGVHRIITIGTTLESSARAIALAEKYPQVWAAVGVHPNATEKAPQDVLTPLRELARHPRVVAIGETGLDYHRLLANDPPHDKAPDVTALGNETPLDVEDSIRDGAVKAAQNGIFLQQLDLAVELGLNVIIHERSSWDDTVATLRPYAGRLRAVFHCFGGPIERAREIAADGHLVSFTGIVTFKNGQIVRETATQVADGGFMVETDCPYLAPVPHRGKRCEPAFTRETALAIAELRGTTLERIASQTEETANGFFRFGR